VRLATAALLLLAYLATSDAAAQEYVRSRRVVREFQRSTGYGGPRPGYVVDHVRPLCSGGPDTVANMQWQTVAEAKVKDADERRLCAQLRAFMKKWAVQK
jgi:hypothetical protein